MQILLLKQAGALSLALINTILLVPAARAHLKRQRLPDGYFRALTASPLLAALLVILGVSLVWQYPLTFRMHYFYGVIVALCAGAQFLMRPGTPAWHINRDKPVNYAFLNLLIALLTFRAWMVG